MLSVVSLGKTNFGRLGEIKCARLTIHEHRNREQTHEAAFGIVHVKAVPKPLLCLAANLAFKALTVARRHEMWREVVAQVLADCSTLGQDKRFGERRCSDGDQR